MIFIKLVYRDVMWLGDLQNRRGAAAYFWIIEKNLRINKGRILNARH